MGKPSAPPSPDYKGAAIAQGDANRQGAVESAYLSTPNYKTPYGGQGVDWSGEKTGSPLIPYIDQYLTPVGQATVDQQQLAGLGLATTANQQQQAIGNLLSTPFTFGPTPQMSLPAPGPIAQGPQAGQYGQASGISIAPPTQGQGQLPPQQSPAQRPPGFDEAFAEYNRLFDAGNRGPELGAALTKLNQFGDQLATDGGGRYVAASPQQMQATQAQQAAQAQPSGFSQSGIQTGLNESDVARMPINAGMTAQQAIMARLNPSLQQQRTSYETQLANQGLVPGGEAYDNAIRNLGQQENDARTQAVLQGLGLDLTANQQGFGQALARGQFANQGIGQNFGMNLAAQDQANQAVGQNFGMGLQSGQFNNAAQQQGFNQALQSGQFGNTALQQALAQALTQRQLPINEITALLSGSQVQNPVFPQYQGQTVTPAPTFAGTQAQGQWDQNLYNQQVASRNALLGGLFGLGGAGVTGLFGLGAR